MLISLRVETNWWKLGTTDHVPLPASCPSSHEDREKGDSLTWRSDQLGPGALLPACHPPTAFLQSVCSWAWTPDRTVRMLSESDSVLKWKVDCMVWPENYGAKSPLHRCALLETYQDCSNSSCNVWIGPVPFDVATAMIENLISEQGAKEAIVAMTWDCRVLKSEVRFLPFEQVSDGRL